MSPVFVHLPLHSEYSLIDGLVRLPPMMAALRAMASPAVALTDLNNLFGLVKFFQAAQTAGIKPIAGAEVCACTIPPPPPSPTAWCCWSSITPAIANWRGC